MLSWRRRTSDQCSKSSSITGSPTLARLPRDVLREILIQVTEMDGCLKAIPALCVVCREWNVLLAESYVWEAIAKRHCPVLPLIQTSDVAPDLVDTSTFRMRLTNGAISQQIIRHHRSSSGVIAQGHSHTDLCRPTKEAVRAALHDIQNNHELQRLNGLVSRRRRFVLQSWLGAGLFFTTASVVSGSCTAEGWDPITLCNANVTFSFLYLAYSCVFGVFVSNIVMQTHFTPLALIPRVQKRTQLILASIALMTLFLVSVIWPTYMVQRKISIRLQLAEGPDEQSWLECVTPLIAAFVLWQSEVVVNTARNVIRWVQAPEFSAQTMSQVCAHFTPSLFAVSVFATARYIESGAYWLLLPTCLPLAFVIGVLCAVFLVDFKQRQKVPEGITTISLFFLMLAPLVLLVTNEPRGMYGFPLAVGSGLLFIGQMRSVIQLVDEAITGPDVEML